MNKFAIENVLIEKSDKDISLGIDYEFSNGINLICGRNEAGKSSLMNFIKMGLFPEKGEDVGKIFFTWKGKKYRVDVNLKATNAQRCKLYELDNSQVDYSLIQSNMTEKDFKQGFFINLDDLMNVQSKSVDVLIDLIKDSSSKKLKEEVDKRKEAIKKVYGEKNRLTKVVQSILDEISSFNHQINELSNYESLYNSAISTINHLNEELNEISKKEEYVEIFSKIKALNEKLVSKKEEVQHLALNYNEKLFLDKQQCVDLLTSAVDYKHYLTRLDENNKILENLNIKINSNISSLNRDFFVNFTIENFLNFEVDLVKLKKIKEQIKYIQEFDKELIAKSEKKSILEENLLRKKHELFELAERIKDIDNVNNLKELYSFVDEGLKQYNCFKEQISETEKNIKINSGGIISNKNLLILLGSMFVFTVFSAVFSFYQKVPVATIFSILMAIFTAIGFMSLKLSCYKDKQNSEIERMLQLQSDILNDLKSKLKGYYSEIDNVESSYLPTKLNDLKQEIYNKIQLISNIDEQIIKNQTETNMDSDKLNDVISKIKEIENKKYGILEDNKNIMNTSSLGVEMHEEQYLEAVELIQIIKEDLLKKISIEQSNEEINNKIAYLLKEFKNFIVKNEINIALSENFNENIEKLKQLNEDNTKVKNDLDILNIDVKNLEKNIESLEIDLNKYSFENAPVETDLVELQLLKTEKIKLKDAALGQKSSLEKVEGLESLKIKKDIKINEYNKKIKELIENKMMLSLCEMAKRNFDKNQPDLQNAQKYLSILTDGKYSKINLDLKEIQNENSTKTKEWKNLSRGTKELLYFALRLGFASNYSKDKVTLNQNGKPDLPMIIDDAFVNFDSVRTKNAIKCLIEFSKTNQVLFFTCHTEVMKKYFEELCNDYKVINL